MNFDLLKKYWFVPLLVGYLGLGQFFEGLQPIFRFQLEAHAAASSLELQNVACATIVAGYANAKRANDQAMIDYWVREAAKYQCTLPPI